MLNSKIIKKLITFILFVSISISIGLIITNISKSGDKQTNNTDGLKGLGLFISNKNNNIHNHIIDYSHLDDYKYTFINNTGKDLDCNLNVFVNGKQISLLNTNNGQSDLNFKFSVNNDDSIDIPIKLILDNLKAGSYIVNFNIVSDYDKYAVDTEDDVWLTSCYNYTVGIENNSKVLDISEAKTPLKSNEIIDNMKNSSQFIVNYSKLDFENGSKPLNYIKASSNTTITIPIVIGGSDATNSLIYATLDNKQIKINDSDVIVCNLKENIASVINLNLTVPNKPGKYELLFYSLNNFINSNIENYGDLKFSQSHRITLEVK